MVKRFKIIILSCILVFMSYFCKAQNQVWQVVSSKITFKIKNAGFMVDGKLGGLNANIQFDTSKDFGNKIEASIDASTISTGITARDNHLKKEEYLYIDKYPKISMISSSITKESDGKFKGLFNLSLKGITKIVPIIFTISQQSDKTVFSGNFSINRRDYSVGSSNLILSDDVTIYLEVSCIKK